MKYTEECDLADFPAWSGGNDTLETLRDNGDCDRVEEWIEEVTFGDEEPVTKTHINDLLWFERDAIAEYLGFPDWEAYEKGEEDDEEEDEEEEEESKLLPDALWAVVCGKAMENGKFLKTYLEDAKSNFVIVASTGKAIYWHPNPYDYVVYGDKEEATAELSHGLAEMVMSEYDYLVSMGFDWDVYESEGLI